MTERGIKRIKCALHHKTKFCSFFFSFFLLGLGFTANIFSSSLHLCSLTCISYIFMSHLRCTNGAMDESQSPLRGKSENWGSFSGPTLTPVWAYMLVCVRVSRAPCGNVQENVCSECLMSYSSNPSTHPSPPTSLSSLQPISFPIFPSKWLHFMELRESADFAVAAFPWAMLQCCKLTLFFLPLGLSFHAI